MSLLLSIQNIGKAYRVYRSESRRFASWFGLPAKPSEEHWVLRHMSFEVHSGEAVGIVGQNGAGKSTLLKMIVGTLKPTEGKVQINGRIAAILELGMGFNPELTGRQNAIHALGLMGFNAEEVHKIIPKVEEFSEIGEYFDEPVRTYSSGMQMRVAFAVATAYRPEILIIDEALSVGDAYFQHKSFGRIRDFQEKGTTLLIVSHDLETVKFLCNRAILIDNGMVVKEGKPSVIIDYYNALTVSNKSSLPELKFYENSRRTEYGNKRVFFSNVELINSCNSIADVIKVGEKIELIFTIEVKYPEESIVIGCGITDRLGQMMFGTNTKITNQIIRNAKAGDRYKIRAFFEASLGVGSYAVHCSIVSENDMINNKFDWQNGALIFNVVNIDQPQFVGFFQNDIEFYFEKII